MYPTTQEVPGNDKSLPKYYLNADGLLNKPLPALNEGGPKFETISYVPNITKHYNGPLAEWDTFENEVMAFYENDTTRKELDRCAHAPINMDPAVEILNSKAMTHERLQCGAEISLSGRYF